MKKIMLIIIMAMAAKAAMPQQFGQMGRLYQNPYQTNPAMAGNDGTTSIYLNYSNQWNKINGAPKALSLSGSTPLNERAYVGLNVFSDKSGLLRKTQGMGTFAYHFPLGEKQKLRLGVSLSWTDDRLDADKAIGDLDDPLLMGYNDRSSYLDGNFGVGYTFQSFEAQFSWLSINNKRYGRIATVDRSLYYASLAYSFNIDDNFSLKPRIGYRHLDTGKDNWDVAMAWGVDIVDIYTVYHSTNSFTGGFGVRTEKNFRLGFYYSNEAKETRSFSGGVFDIVVGYVFPPRKK
ncbi:PorP/SprF family type IX secretion system membrane protein [Pseudopedobacter beijingensis]|uniref:PorP/SprF family type IX secretion system membrane protein n=1 Tax=Pseudopedobacter beijingensis TaxID=1207056 RepID=A0ABW4I7L7_9SPHI